MKSELLMGTQSMVALPSVAQTAPRRGNPEVLELFEKAQLMVHQAQGSSPAML